VAGRTLSLIYEPRAQFLPFHTRQRRWSVLVCHRRAGKTVAAVNDLVIGALECPKPRPQYAYVAPFRNQAKLIAWEYLKYYARPFLSDKPNESELSVRLFGDRKVMLAGADNADALRGIYLDGVVQDEFGDFRPSVWGNVIRPALSDRKGWAVFGGTPKGRNEFWQMREMARKNPAEWFLLEMRASESGLLDAEEVRAAQRQLSPDQFAQEYECDFAAALPGAYFGREMVQAEREGRIRAVEVEPALPVHTAWDIGYRDDTAIWFYQVLRGEVHLIDFHASSGQSIAYYADLIKSKGFNYGKHWLPHDARAKTLASGGKSVVEQLAASLGGFAALAIVPNLEVQDGIQAARMVLPRCWFDEEKCTEGLEALRQYQREYDEDTKAFKERPRHDWTSHASDAFRMLAVAWRQEAVQEPQPKGKFFETQSLDELWDEQPAKAARI
jgi:phage terminase large subunit